MGELWCFDPEYSKGERYTTSHLNVNLVAHLVYHISMLNVYFDLLISEIFKCIVKIIFMIFSAINFRLVAEELMFSQHWFMEWFCAVKNKL